MDWRLLEEKKTGRGVDLVGVFKSLTQISYRDFTLIFTDGSKEIETGVTGFGVVVPEKGVSLNRRTTNRLSVYTVEMVAVLMVLRWAEHARVERVLICCDSASVLTSLRSFHSGSRQGLLYEILMCVTRCVSQVSIVRFLWVPAHVGVGGNEEADTLAKRALKKERVDMHIRISKAEAKGIIWEKANQLWQARWDKEEKGRHFYQVERSVKGQGVRSGSRRDEIVWMRLRLGHCALNKTLKMIGRHQSGLCEGCGEEEESVEHVLLWCRAYEEHRRKMRDKMRSVGILGFEGYTQ